jgi:hypothetical protein
MLLLKNYARKSLVSSKTAPALTKLLVPVKVQLIN